MIEYCEGGTLSEYLKAETRLTEEQARGVIADLAEGTKFLQSKNIIHRDLKPENVLLSYGPDGKLILKIADFTFARYIETGDLATTICGTPLYMAPEILITRQYDGKVDLWSLGVMFYEMLVGVVPFAADTIIELIDKINKWNPAIPSHIKISDPCKQLIFSLLKKEPKNRIDWDQFFNHEFLKGTSPASVKRSSHINSSLIELQARIEEFQRRITDQQKKFDEQTKILQEKDDQIEKTNQIQSTKR